MEMEQMIVDRPLPYRVGEKWGYIDTTGRCLTNAHFDNAAEFGDGFAYTGNSGRMHIIDRDLRVTGTLDGVTSFDRFAQGLLQVQRTDDEKYIFINTAGRRAFDVVCDNAFSFSCDRAFVAIDGVWGMLDLAGRWIVTPKYEWVVPFVPGSRTTSVCRRGSDSAELIDQEGRTVMSRPVPLLRQVVDGVVPFGRRVDGVMRFGVMDEHGNEIIAPQFAECDDGFRAGLLGVEVDNGKWGVIDRSGRWVLPPSYTYIGECRDGLLLAYKGGGRTLDRWLIGGNFGYVRPAGEVRIPFQFDEAHPFEGGIATVTWYKDPEKGNTTMRRGYVSVEGRIIWRESFDP